MSSHQAPTKSNRRLLPEEVYESCLKRLNSLFIKKSEQEIPVGAWDPEKFLDEIEPLLIGCIMTIMPPHSALMDVVYRLAIMRCLRSEDLDFRGVGDLAAMLIEKIKACAREISMRITWPYKETYKNVNMSIMLKCVLPILNCIASADVELYQSLITAASQRT